MNNFDRELNERLEALREQGLIRELRVVDSPQTPHIQVEGKPLLNFASNDYLGLANEAALKQAAIQAIERFGAGAGASRLISGTMRPHDELEEALAFFQQTEAALAFSSGYAAAVGTICSLFGKDDIIVLDKLVHACIVDAARLSGAKLRVFGHNDLDKLQEILCWATKRPGKPRVLVATESVFSMDGDHAPLRQIVELKDKHGALLMVDEAHATGLYGENRRGLAEELGIDHRIEIHMGTLSKAIGASGGFICGSRPLISLLVNRARPFVFSTAPVPAAAAAARAGIRIIQSDNGEQRRTALWRRVAQLVSGEGPIPSTSERSAIIPILLGDELAAVETSAALRERGLFIPAIRYPTVARGRARLRLTLTASHSTEEIERVRAALASLINRPSEPAFK